MNEIIVRCPNCGTDNHIFPLKIVEIGYFSCIKCGKSLPLVFYDEYLPLDHQQHNEKEDQE